MSAFAATAMSATDYVLDLSKPAYPEVINFTANGNAQVWSDTYNENEYILEFSPYMFSHLASGSSWNGTYWDGFTIVKCGDNATQTNWIANQWGNMAGGGINANGKADASVPYMFAYCPDFMPNICTMMYDDEKTYYVKGMYVNIAAYSYYACKNGASPANAFTKEGDSFKLTVSGKDDADTPFYFAIDKLTVTDVPPVPTAVDDVTAAKVVASVKYVNLAGQVSDSAFDGVNVKVTTYTDGTTRSEKMMK